MLFVNLGVRRIERVPLLYSLIYLDEFYDPGNELSVTEASLWTQTRSYFGGGGGASTIYLEIDQINKFFKNILKCESQ